MNGRFIKNFLNEIDHDNSFSSDESEVPTFYKEYIKQYKRIGQYTDPEGAKLDVLSVNLKRETSPKRARTMQRNFVGWYLKSEGHSKDSALVAFYHEDAEDWRFSYVKRGYRSEEDETGKIKIKEELTPPRRFSFLVGENEPSNTAQNQIVPILENDKDNPTLLGIETAFNVETVTNEFFEKYRNLSLRLKEALDEIVERDLAIKTDFETKKVRIDGFAKKLLSQIVFLYFLQKKGWFGVNRGEKWGYGSKRFIRELFSGRGNKNFFNDVLEPLFYQALRYDRRADDDYYNEFRCKIPFLNGGLFDPINNYDWVNTDIFLPDDLFSNKHETNQGDIGDGILDIFDRYNFTVKEDEPLEREVAVDPEMLGKVFENLLEVKERKSKGTYYTPREIVHYMCQESLINYLNSEFDGSVDRNDFEKLIKYGESFSEHSTVYVKSENLNGNEIDNKAKFPESIGQNAALIDKKLASIRICDPAVGSGAFVVGMMNEITGARNALTPYLQDSGERTSYNFKRDAIQDCLYGVDIDPIAVEIAKLRLWLSLIVDEKKRESIQPLPNLDYKIVNGNSLLNYPYTSSRLEKIEKFKAEFFGETHPSVKRQLKDKVDKAIMRLMENTESSIGYKMNFDFKIFFSEIFHEKDGFDVVIGNPPYVKEYVEKSAFEGLRSSPYYKGKMDLWYFFVCRGIDILKKDSGILAFIAQNNWLTSYGASKMRDKIIRDSQILTLVDFGDFKIFDAGIQTMVMLFKRSVLLEKYKFDYRKLYGKNLKFKDLISVLTKEDNLSAEYLTPEIERNKFLDKNLTFSSPEIEEILNKLLSKSDFQLTDKEVANGIHHHHDYVHKKHIEILCGNNHKVGDGVFVLSNEEKKQLQLTKKELELIKPHYTTKELSRWCGNSKNKEWVIYTDSSFKDKSKIKDYPNLKKHLDQFKQIITSDNKPYGLHRARKESFFKGEKIVAVRKCATPAFTYVDFDSYVSAAFYVIKTKRINQKYLTAILNSKLITFWLKNKGKRQGSNYQIDKEPIMAIPLLTLTHVKGKQELLIDLVDKILAIKKDDDYLQNTAKQAETKEKETQIDQLVYELYGLTQEEINIIENTK